jgi:hypothetical protein
VGEMLGLLLPRLVGDFCFLKVLVFTLGPVS